MPETQTREGKRLECPVCGDSFQTPQGFGGHLAASKDPGHSCYYSRLQEKYRTQTGNKTPALAPVEAAPDFAPLPASAGPATLPNAGQGNPTATALGPLASFDKEGAPVLVLQPSLESFPEDPAQASAFLMGLANHAASLPVPASLPSGHKTGRIVIILVVSGVALLLLVLALRAPRKLRRDDRAYLRSVLGPGMVVEG